MIVPSLLVPIAVAVAAERTARRRERALDGDGRAALARLRSEGLDLEWEIRTVAAALAKVARISSFHAFARTRAGLMLAWAEGSLPLRPGRRALVRAALAGHAEAQRRGSRR